MSTSHFIEVQNEGNLTDIMLLASEPDVVCNVGYWCREDVEGYLRPMTDEEWLDFVKQMSKADSDWEMLDAVGEELGINSEDI